MPLIWKEENSVGVKMFDLQHKELFDIINELIEAINNKKFNDVIDDIMVRLVDYGNYHLSTEEKFFDQYDYPEKDSHKALHDEYINKINSFQQRYQNQDGEIDIAFDLVNFLENWWVNHINGADKKYSEFFNGKGVY
ncbi:MAG: bacteriohemerythrin [Candidatus Magasanikbacteria bacterium]|nr:bacteriohemerythrin [Candidatus Magasanikbacteria bacterium]